MDLFDHNKRVRNVPLSEIPTPHNILNHLYQLLLNGHLADVDEINITDPNGKQIYLVVMPGTRILSIHSYFDIEGEQDEEYRNYHFKAEVYPGASGLLEPILEVSTILDIQGERHEYLPRFGELMQLTVDYFNARGQHFNHIGGKWNRYLEEGVDSTNYDTYAAAIHTMPRTEAVFATPTGKIAKRLGFEYPLIMLDIDEEEGDSVYVIFSKYPREV